MTTTRFSILVATMNRPQAIAKLLETVEKQTFLPQECILVDQSKDDLTKDVCDTYVKRMQGRGQVFKYIRQETPSLVKARNRGVDESTGEIICFIDDDLILDQDYFQRIAFYFQDPAIGGVTGNVILSNPFQGFKWEIRKLIVRFFMINSFNGRLTPSTFGYPIYEREVSQVQEVELFGGYSMNFRREFVLRHRPDEWFSGYGYREDVDLSYRISRDAKLIIVPDARFVHDISTINRLDTGALKMMQFKNYWYCFKKFRKPGALSGVLFWYSMFGIVFLDFVEFLSGFKKHKWAVFMANFPAIRQMRD
jgi:glycosyltransferase involved in cell wall biosynthesis